VKRSTAWITGLTASILLAVLGGPIAAQTDIPTATAEIAAWNLSGFRAIPREQVPAFAGALVRLDPEILAIVEVNPDYVAGELVAEMIDRGLCYRRTIVPQSAHQNVAVLHKCAVTVTNPRLIPGSDDGNFGLRKALAVDVTMGAFDFVLVVLHLKAGGDDDDQATRSRQAAVLDGFVRSVTQGAEKDVLIVGDYNMDPERDPPNFAAMNPDGFLRFLTSEDLPPGAFTHIWSSGVPGNLLDGFAVSAAHTGEYLAGSLQVVPLHEELGLSLLEYREQVSDHLPVIARFVIVEDDD
jgi:endonuclease/exonuclease/phosphatase family metal-dependent hydrolase